MESNIFYNTVNLAVFNFLMIFNWRNWHYREVYLELRYNSNWSEGIIQLLIHWSCVILHLLFCLLLWKLSRIVWKLTVLRTLNKPTYVRQWDFLFTAPCHSLYSKLKSIFYAENIFADCVNGPKPFPGNAAGIGPAYSDWCCSSGHIQCSRHSSFWFASFYQQAQNGYPSIVDRATPSVSTLQILVTYAMKLNGIDMKLRPTYLKESICFPQLLSIIKSLTILGNVNSL